MMYYWSLFSVVGMQCCVCLHGKKQIHVQCKQHIQVQSKEQIYAHCEQQDEVQHEQQTPAAGKLDTC